MTLETKQKLLVWKSDKNQKIFFLTHLIMFERSLFGRPCEPIDVVEQHWSTTLSYTSLALFFSPSLFPICIYPPSQPRLYGRDGMFIRISNRWWGGSEMEVSWCAPTLFNARDFVRESLAARWIRSKAVTCADQSVSLRTCVSASTKFLISRLDPLKDSCPCRQLRLHKWNDVTSRRPIYSTLPFE